MTTAYFRHEECLGHVTPPGHPEQVARLEVIERALAAPQYAALERRDAPVGRKEDVLLCHPAAYFERVQASIPADGFLSLDADTHVTNGSFEAALRGVGGITAAVDAVLDGTVGNAFVACRPPGHHAETETAMGFCLFGNVAIGARHALERRGLNRVAVIDFDVHHGNGTQDLLWAEERAMFVSSHQMPLYPGSGRADERGAHGQIMNRPLAAGTDGSLMRQVYGRDVFPAIEAFAPELILVSAGFDAHEADPLANLNWTTEDFAWITREICALAARICGGRVVSTLEGGYDLDALGAAVAVHVTELMEHSG